MLKEKSLSPSPVDPNQLYGNVYSDTHLRHIFNIVPLKGSMFTAFKVCIRLLICIYTESYVHV